VAARHREVVTTVKLWISQRRPSVLARLCAPTALTAFVARGRAVGELAVQVPGQLASSTGGFGASDTSVKINYIGAIALGEGTATSIHCDQPIRVLRAYKVQAEMAGGIPPRGRPV
jgi:hypothetical protein